MQLAQNRGPECNEQRAEAEMQAIDPSDLLCFASFYFSVLIQVLPSATFFSN
jgi:hypothetical protein